MTGETSDDAQWTGRALARLPAVQPAHGFEAGLLAAYDGWNEKRAAGWTSGLAGAVRGLCHFIWPGVPAHKVEAADAGMPLRVDFDENIHIASSADRCRNRRGARQPRANG